MSYGIWKRRGRGWSSIEIDTPDYRYLQDLLYGSKKYQTYAKYLINQLRKYNHDIYFFDQDVHAIKWGINQLRKDREISVEANGEHVTWIAKDKGC